MSRSQHCLPQLTSAVKHCILSVSQLQNFSRGMSAQPLEPCRALGYILNIRAYYYQGLASSLWTQIPTCWHLLAYLLSSSCLPVQQLRVSLVPKCLLLGTVYLLSSKLEGFQWQWTLWNILSRILLYLTFFSTRTHILIYRPFHFYKLFHEITMLHVTTRNDN